MSADFWAGYISGAVGILIGNPLDLLKVRLQAGNLDAPATTATLSIPQPSAGNIATPRSHISYVSQFSTMSTLVRGASAPILGYGALNALLFMTYNRTSSLLTYGTLTPPHLSSLSVAQQQQLPTLWTTFVSGALGGLATWVISTPTELIKCRAQTAKSTHTNISSQTTSPSINTTNSTSSYNIARSILAREGIRGLYFGGVVTALRDSIGYGFYFWSYELSTRFMVSRFPPSSSLDGENGNARGDVGIEALKVLLCGGLAGVITWASVFPLDVIKTRVQTQLFSSTSISQGEHGSLLGSCNGSSVVEGRRRSGRIGAIEMARNAYGNEGFGVFFRGLGICSVRAFIVNAVQWAVYEWIMRELNPSSMKGSKEA